MSVALMSLAFKAQVPATQKLVLLALCDAANDQGECYPSIPTLAEKCSMGERTVQEAIAALEQAGAMRREFRKGRSTTYWVTPADCAPRRLRTPAAAAPPPPQQPHHTPADCAPTPADCAPITITQPSRKQKRSLQAVASGAALPSETVDWTDSKARGLVAIPDDFDLPDEWGEDAEKLGWKPAAILHESERFRQYWTRGRGAGKRRTVRGWRQAWSNWLARAERMAA